MSRRREVVERWVPGARAARTYQRDWLRLDPVAGIVLTAILVPQGMAYAKLAGVPAVNGLYATVGCLVGYALFGPSRVLVLGPDSSVSQLIFAAIVRLAVPDDVQARVARAGTLALLAGKLCGFSTRATSSVPHSRRQRASATASVHDDVIVRVSRLASACPMEALSTRHRKICTDPEGGEA